MLGVPVHVVLTLISLISLYTNLEQSKAKGHQSYSRSIQSSWYTKYQWISVCMASFKVYCNICCSARKRGLVKFGYNLAFVEGGFSNWKKALQRFSEHEKNEIHREALTKVSSLTKSVDVGVQLSTQHDAEMKNHRAMFMKLLDCVLFLARQGLSFRGHYENSTGNLYQLLLLQAKDSAAFGLWLKRREYISPEIINENLWSNVIAENTERY